MLSSLLVLWSPNIFTTQVMICTAQWWTVNCASYFNTWWKLNLLHSNYSHNIPNSGTCLLFLQFCWHFTTGLTFAHHCMLNINNLGRLSQANSLWSLEIKHYWKGYCWGYSTINTRSFWNLFTCKCSSAYMIFSWLYVGPYRWIVHSYFNEIKSPSRLHTGSLALSNIAHITLFLHLFPHSSFFSLFIFFISC